MRDFFNIHRKKRTKKGYIGAAKKRIIVLTLSNLALQVLWFFYRLMLTKLAGSETLGLQSLVMQVYSIMVSVCIAGLNVAVLTVGARIAGGSNAANGIRALFRTALGLFLLLFGLMAAPMFVFRERLAANLIGDREAALSIVLVLGCIFMTGIENIQKSIHVAAGHVAKTAASELMEQSIRFLLVYIALKNVASGTDHGKVALIFGGMLASEFFSVSFLLSSYKRLFGSRGGPYLGADTSVRSIVSILAPAGLTSIVGTVFASAASLLLPGRLMLAGFTRAQALSSIGVLNAAALPIVMMPMTFVGAVSTVLLPSVSAASAKGDMDRVRQLTMRSFRAALLTVILINIPLMRFAGNISGALFGTVPTAFCFELLTIKTAVIYFQILTATVLNGLMKQRKVLLFALIGESMQLVLIWLLTAVPTLHFYGFLIAQCIGEALRLVISMLYLRRVLSPRGIALTKETKKADRMPARLLKA